MSKNLVVACAVILVSIAFSCNKADDREMNHDGMGSNSTEMRRNVGNMMTTGESDIQRAVAILNPGQGGKVKGIVTFTMAEDGKVRVVADVEGLTPGRHGFHVHQFGDCSAADFNSAGPHFMAEEEPHGAPESDKRHTGDLGNLSAGKDGKAHLEWTDSHMSFSGRNSIVGRSVVVHGGEDDLKSQPAGNSGPRVACGVIGIMK